MWLKILTLVVAAVGAWMLIRRALGSRTPAPPTTTAVDVLRGRFGRRGPKPAKAEELIACPTCGAWRAKGDLCECSRTPTP